MHLTLAVSGTRSLSPTEMRDIDGGFIPLVIIGVAILLSGCATTQGNNQVKEAGGGPYPQPDTTSTQP